MSTAFSENGMAISLARYVSLPPWTFRVAFPQPIDDLAFHVDFDYSCKADCTVEVRGRILTGVCPDCSGPVWLLGPLPGNLFAPVPAEIVMLCLWAVLLGVLCGSLSWFSRLVAQSLKGEKTSTRLPPRELTFLSIGRRSGRQGLFFLAGLGQLSLVHDGANVIVHSIGPCAGNCPYAGLVRELLTRAGDGGSVENVEVD
jgi:hypothetical protein